MTACPADVTFDTILHRSEDVLCHELGGEAVLLDLASEPHFGLDPVGTRILELVDGRASLGTIHSALCAEYDADPARTGDDLMTLARSLAEAGLVRTA